VAHSLAVCVQGLHHRDMPHGTIKTRNAFLDGKEVRLADYGLLPLKKFLKLTRGYSNKSVYTAPEILADRCKQRFMQRWWLSVPASRQTSTRWG
jgi:serine/threonine protein kinase